MCSSPHKEMAKPFRTTGDTSESTLSLAAVAAKDQPALTSEAINPGTNSILYSNRLSKNRHLWSQVSF